VLQAGGQFIGIDADEAQIQISASRLEEADPKDGCE